MSEELKQELIERYLDGQMNDSEKAAFEAQLRSDTALAEAVALEQAARSLVVQAGREALRSRLNTFENEWQAARTAPKPVLLSRRRLFAVAAAVLALSAALVWFFVKPAPKPADLFAAHFQPYRAPSPERGAAATDAWQRAAAAYAAGDYKIAAGLFNESLGDSTAIPYQCHFYLGVSLLAQQPPLPEAAVFSFDKTLKSDNDYRQQAMWYKALALLKLGQQEAAGEVLNEIVRQDYFHRREAEEVLRGK